MTNLAVLFSCASAVEHITKLYFFLLKLVRQGFHFVYRNEKTDRVSSTSKYFVYIIGVDSVKMRL